MCFSSRRFVLLLLLVALSLSSVHPVCAQYVERGQITSEGTPNTKTDGLFANALKSLGEVSGSPRLVVGASGENGELQPDAGRVYLVNGNTGELLEALSSQNGDNQGEFGASVGRLGDITNDGVPELIVGAPLEEAISGETNAGYAYIFNGSNGNRIQTLQTGNTNIVSGRHFGTAVAGVGDVGGSDGGAPDVVVGAPEQTSGGEGRAGKAYILSGGDGDVIDVLTGGNENTGLFGSSVLGVGDVIGGPKPDFLIGAPREDVGTESEAGKVYLVDGNDGSKTVITSPSPESGAQFGRALSAVGPEDSRDFLIAASNETVGGKRGVGRVYLVDGASPNSSPLEVFDSPKPDGANDGDDAGSFGEVVRTVGDANGDEVKDVLVGAPGEDVGATEDAGRVYLLSGSDGSILDEFVSSNVENGGRFGTALAAFNDLDGDSVLDVAIGAPEETVGSRTRAGRSYIFTVPDVAFIDGRNGEAYDPPSATAGESAVPMGRFKLSTDDARSALESVTVSNQAATTPSDVTSLELWESDDNSFATTGDNTKLADKGSYSDVATFSSLGRSISTGGTYYFVVVDLGSSPSGEYDPAIASEADVALANGQIATVNGSPQHTFSVSSGEGFLSTGPTGPLPVELTTFDGTVTDDGVALQWRTASETNNAGFRVERRVSETGTWSAVGFREAKGDGTSAQPQTYAFTDTDVPYSADTLRYRLAQEDLDGTVNYSDPVTVTRGAVAQVELRGTYPNPVRDQATLHYAVPDRQTVRIHLYNVLGQRVRTVASGPRSGRTTTQVDVSGLASGIYVLRLAAGGTTRTQRLTVVK